VRFRGCLVAWVVGWVVDGDGSKEDPGVDVVERGEVFVLCLGAESAPEVGCEGGWVCL
jgi:hypothetical protein